MHSSSSVANDDYGGHRMDARARPPLAPVARLRVVEDDGAGGELTLVPSTEAALDRDPGLLCANLALCIVEILAGARSLDHIARWVTDAVFVQLLRRTVLAARARTATGEKAMRPRVRIGIPHTCALSEGVVEAVVVVHQRTRSRAIAMRLERHRTRWRATAITVL